MSKKKNYKIKAIPTAEEVFKKDPREKYLYYRIYLYFYGLFWSLVRLPREIRLAVKTFYQRGKRGWADSDTWAFHDYLSKVIAEGVKHLKEINHGLPTWKEGKTELECINEWDCILNTIYNTFETAKRIGNTEAFYLPLSKWSDKEYKQLKSIAKEMNFYCKVLNKKETKEYELGFKYFQRYFFCLND